VPLRTGGLGTRICVERGLGGIVVITPVIVEVWMSSLLNDRDHVGSGHGHVRPIGRSGCRGWGSSWFIILSEGSTCPSSKTEVS
jgi:hypothetical protein